MSEPFDGAGAAQGNPADPRRLAGMTLGGKYIIESLLGAGGYGAVYLGTHASLGGKVAVKVLLSKGGANEEFSQRFRREAATLSRLRHPHVVDVIDFGQDSGVEYLVLEYIAGRALADVVKQDAPLSWIRALHISRQVLLALAAAHEIGVVHRDLKPANVMLEDLPGAKDHVQVLDFGIAKIVDPASDLKREGDEATRVGLALGTPRYMSPEQCKGKPLDGRSDLYSLGILLFEMLTGYRPFDGATPMDILAAHMHEPVPPLPPAPYGPPHPLELEPLLNQLLAKDRDDRPSRAEDVVEAIDLICAAASAQVPVGSISLPGLIITPSGGTPLAGEQIAIDDPIAHRRTPVGLIAGIAGGALALLALVIGLVVGLSGSGDEKRDPSLFPTVRFVLTSKPSGADVKMDGKPLGETPYTASLEGPAAALAEKGRFEVRLEGHSLRDFSLNLKQDEEGDYVRGHVVFEEKRVEPEPAPDDEDGRAGKKAAKRRSKRKKRPARKKGGVHLDPNI